MRSFVAAVPLSFVALGVSLIVSVVLAPAVARRLQTSRPLAAFLLFGFGFALSATLVPGMDALAGIHSDGSCDLSRIGLIPTSDLFRIGDPSLNVLLFVPLGLAVGLLPRTRAAAVAVVAAILLTFVIEATQLVVTPLGRGCQSADIFDNLLGLAIGIVTGALARPILGSAGSGRPPA
jgi:hypothetical protein